MAEGPSETKTLKVGDEAPDFTLRDYNMQPFHLADHRGKNVVLNFFPGAFSGVCSVQMPRIQEQKTMFGDDTVVVGVGVDNPFALKAWATQLDIDFPLLSDYYPHGGISEKYGVLTAFGAPERAVIGIDKEGKIAYINVNPMTEVPDLTPCAIALEKAPA